MAIRICPKSRRLLQGELTTALYPHPLRHDLATLKAKRSTILGNFMDAGTGSCTTARRRLTIPRRASMARAGKAARVVGQGDTDRIGLLSSWRAASTWSKAGRSRQLGPCRHQLARCNDVPLAFVGYSICRKELIRAGVIQEVRWGHTDPCPSAGSASRPASEHLADHRAALRIK